MPDITTMEFLQALFPDPVGPGRLVVWTRSRRSGKRRSHWVHTLGQAAAEAHRYQLSREAFFSLTLHDPMIARGMARTRWPRVQLPSVCGCFDSAVALPALWAEIRLGSRPDDRETAAGQDAAGGSSSTGLSSQQAFQLLGTISVPPSIMVHTGAAYEVYWVLRRLWLLESDADRSAAKDMLRRLQAVLDRAARALGGAVEHHGDLARLLRIPNLHNFKQGQDVTIEHFPRVPTPGAGAGGDHRYALEDFASLPEPPEERVIEHLLRGSAPPSGGRRPRDLTRILAGCYWLRGCAAESHGLSVQAWRAVLGVVGRCIAGALDGRRLAHRFSERHPGYNPVKTEERLAQALRAKPPTCRWIAEHLGARQRCCSRCPHFERSGSPLDLDRSTVDASPESRAGGASDSLAATPGEIPGSHGLRDEAAVHHDLVFGLAEMLRELGGAAPARQIVEHLTKASASSFRRLRRAVSELFPQNGARLPSPLQLSGKLRTYRDRCIGGAYIDQASRCHWGMRWTVRQAVAAEPGDEYRALA